MVVAQQQKRSGWTTALIALVVVALVVGAVAAGIVGLRSSARPVIAAPAAVIGWVPGITRGVSIAGPITVYFNRGMDHGSVEKAWKLRPKTRGSFHWSANSVSFQPSVPFEPGTYYRLQIGRSALDDQKRHLTRPFSIVFVTGDALRITGKTPADGTTDVPATSVISITFNHPMVALAGLGAPVENPPGWHVSISPHTPGSGAWLGTSTWVFHPREGLHPSSRYRVTISGDAHDAWGLGLGEDGTWSFSTVRPATVAVAPPRGSSTADPSSPVSVTFNQPMDVGSTVQAFNLRTGSGSVPGSTSWNGNTLQFQPAVSLDSNRVYTATIRKSALAANGKASIERPFSWTFRVAPPPRVISSKPSNGSVNAPSYVEIHFSAPMNVASLDHALSISPALSNLSTYGSGTLYSISGDFRPSTAYTVSFAPGAADKYGRTMQDSYTLRFNTAPITPSATLYGAAGAGPGLAFTAGRVAEAPVQVINVPWVRFTLVRTSLKRVPNEYEFGSDVTIPRGTTIRSWKVQASHPLNQVQNLHVTLAKPDGSPLAPGLYWLAAEGPRGADAAGNDTPPASAEIVAVSDAGVTIKIAQHRALVWVTSARTGRPMPGVSVRLAGNDGNTIASGRTGAQGLSFFHVNNPYNVRSATVTGSAFGMALASWAPSIAGSNGAPLGLPDQKSGGVAGRYLYTDRPIYRPGQTVHFRAVLWADHDGVYGPLGATKAAAEAYDGAGHRVFRRSLTVDRFGTAHGSFTLPAHAGTGGGSIAVSVPHSSARAAYASFAISAYRKPEFITSVVTGKKRYVQGEGIRATVRVRYVFGAPAAGQQVDWTAYSQSEFEPPPGWGSYQFGDISAIQQWYMQQPGTSYAGIFGDAIAHGSGTTDSTGEMSVHLPVDLSKVPANQTITIEATGTDINHQPVTGRVQVSAIKSAEQIGLAPRKQIATAGKPETVDVVTVSADGTPLPGAGLTATIYRRTYTTELTGGTGSLWRQVPQDTEVSSQNVSTDSTGRTSFTFTPEQGGEYYILATGNDDLGKTARAGVFNYASAAGFSDWGTSTNTTIALQPDRQSYRVGQTAKILVAAPFSGATALVTTERGGIRSYRVEHLSSASPTVQVPIGIADVPNIYVTVTLYRGERGASPPEWRYGAAELDIDSAPRTLFVHLSQNRSRYEPGQTATYTVSTTDASGHPVVAEVSLALVDTAVLALQDESTPPILDALYGERPLGVQTMSSGVVSIDGLSQFAGSAVHPSQLGGGGGGGAYAPETVYKRFRDTGYWRADVVTGQGGRATVRVRLPDNFTTWRLDARGVSAGYRAGQATLRTLSTRDTVLRPVTPRFFLQGDSLGVGVVINNDTAHTSRMKVSLHASGLDVSARARMTTVPGHAERLVMWKATVPESSWATLTFATSSRSARQRGYAVRVRVPVHPPLTEEVVATSGQVFGSTKQAVLVPQGAAPKPGDLTVAVSSSVVQGLGRTYSAFAPSRYQSNDDIAARLLAARALLGLPWTLRGRSRLTDKRLRADAYEAAATLARRQLSDGGWPWFTDPLQVSDAMVSADVMLALSSSRSSQRLARGRAYLESQLSRVPADERAFLLLAISHSGHPDSNAAERLDRDAIARAHLAPVAVADLAMSLAASRDRAAARSLVAQLDSTAVVSATGANWEGSELTGGTAVETTAHVLSALLRVAPDDPYVPAAARWLMLSRTGDAWDTPRDSALAVFALAAYARGAREGHASYHYRVSVDGATRLHGRVQPNAAASDSTRVPIGRLHRGGSSVIISRAQAGGSVGGGPLYYVAQLHYFVPAASIPAMDQGVSVKRRYLDLAGKPVSSVAAGSVVQVELTFTTGRTLTHLTVNDPVPSGFEPIDQSLQTSRQGLFEAWESETPPPGVRNLAAFLRHTDLRDDRVSLYADSLPPGSYRFTYLAQATVPGQYAVAPAWASEVFFPEVFGRSAGQAITVQ